MDELTGRTIHGRYRIERELGRGGMGVVYLTQDLRQHDHCALKMLRTDLTHDPRVRRRFIDEATALTRLNHPHIVKARDFFCVGEDCFIALEYVDGISLAHLIEQHGALPETQALAIFKPVLSALDHGHQQGVVHRDVKPNNILIDRASGTPLLCDFGIAKQVAERGVTLSGVTLGTAEYMSPEQVQTPDRVDHRSDVYSAGIVLFEMLTGRVPFVAESGNSDFEVRAQQVRSAPPDPVSINPRIGPGLARIVLKALRKDADTRHAGCAAFRQAIERHEQSGDPPAGPAPPLMRPLPPAAQRRYSVYEHPTRGHLAVKQGFSWPASFGSIFWMFSKGLYVQATKWAAAYVAAFFVLTLAGDSDNWLTSLAWAALPALWVAPGFRGNVWREHDLRRRGFELKGAFPGETADAAVARATRGH
jgi:serine/threonine protein kinase